MEILLEIAGVFMVGAMAFIFWTLWQIIKKRRKIVAEIAEKNKRIFGE
jgi:hypothetical protein